MKRYQDHIDTIAKELSCEIRPSGRMNAMMFVEFGYVECPKIEDQQTYLINLHELGHMKWGHTQGRPPKGKERFYFDNGVLRSEAQAWEFALDQCIDTEVSNENRVFMWDTCLGSYYWHYLNKRGQAGHHLTNGDRHYVSFAYDHPDEFFTSIHKRIVGELPVGRFSQLYLGRGSWD